MGALLGILLGSPICPHQLVDLAPFPTVLGERPAVVSCQLDSPISTVISHLNCFDKVSELDVVPAGVPLGREQGKAVPSSRR